jgi:capsular exopolysaccharide synthesis family protein
MNNNGFHKGLGNPNLGNPNLGNSNLGKRILANRNGDGNDGHQAGPDRQLMLRGKPVEFPTLQVQLMSPPMVDRRPPLASSGGLREYAQMLGRSKWLILTITVGFALLGGIIGLFQTPMYQARTALEVQGPNENFLNQKDMDPAASGGASSIESYVETQARILQDDALLDKTLTKLNLDQKPELVNAGGPLSKVRRLVGWPTAKPSRDAVLRGAVQNLTVHASSQSHIVELSYDAPDPEVAANVANTLADEFIEQNLDNRWKARQRIAKWLSHELETLKGNVEKAAADLQTYARSTGLIFNQQESSTVAQDRLRQVQEEFSRAQAERVSRQSKYEMAAQSSPESLPDVLDDGPLRDAQMKLTELRRQEAELNSTFQPSYYKVKNVRAQIAEVEGILKKQRTHILERIRNEYQAAERRENLLGGTYHSQTGVVSDQAATSVHYQTLKREVETNRALYDSMLQKVREADITSAIRASNIRVISPAKRPGQPYKPKAGFNAGMGLVAGLFLSIAYVFVREQTDRCFKAPGDASAYLNLQELGTIPKANREMSRSPALRPGDIVIDVAGDGTCAKLNGPEPIELASWKNELSPLAESFRTALASVWFTGQNEKRPRVFVLTSPNPSEGKTTVVSNLGISMANTNRRILLVDADIRKPRLHDIFGLDNRWGLGNLLEEDSPVEDYAFENLAFETRVPGLYVLPSGTGDKNISSLRYHDRLADVLARFRLEFHAVLIDTPPVLKFADARLMGRLSDGVILVFRASETSRDDAGMALSRFQEDQTPVLGSILNDCDPRIGRYGYGYRGYDRPTKAG